MSNTRRGLGQNCPTVEQVHEIFDAFAAGEKWIDLNEWFGGYSPADNHIEVTIAVLSKSKAISKKHGIHFTKRDAVLRALQRMVLDMVDAQQLLKGL